MNELNPLQKNLYELLIEIDEICRKYNITYFLAAGGALGAIRNHGFLPWDDDLDVYITRDNWNSFRKIINKELKENRAFICEENTELYYNPIGRYINTESTLMLKSQLLCGECCGVMIEFLIMDPMPINLEEKWQHRENMKLYTELLSPYMVFNNRFIEENRDFNAKLYNKYYIKSLLLGKKYVLSSLKKKFTGFPDNKCKEYCMRWGKRTVIYPKELFGTGRMVNFEGRKFPIMEFAEKSFRIGYGDDWMYVPRRTEQIIHNSVMDLDTPFKVYTDMYFPLIDKSQLLSAYRRSKKKTMDAALKRSKYEKSKTKIKAELAARYIEDTYDCMYLNELLKTNNLDELEKELEYFFSEQFSKELLDYSIIIPVSDQFIYVAAMFLVLKGYYYKADVLVLLREKINTKVNDSILELKKIIKLCRTLSIAIYDENDKEKVSGILSNLRCYKNKLIDYSRAELWLLKRNASSKNDFTKLVDKAQRLIETFGNDGELISFEAYGCYQLGNKELAKEKYSLAVKNTRNGFVWMEAIDLVGINAYKTELKV